MIKIQKYNVLLGLMLLLFCACLNSKQSNALQLPMPENDLVAMLAEIHLAEAAVKMETQIKEPEFPFELEYLYGAIFQKYHFNQQQLNDLLYNLTQNPEQMQDIYTKVETQLTLLSKQIK